MIHSIQTPIIPTSVQFVGKSDQFDLKAICVYTAIGFFLGDDTYYKDLKALKPGHKYVIDGENIISSAPYFKWHHSPKTMNLLEATEEYGALFNRIIKNKLNNRKVILPLSGGLDSRTLAAGLKNADANVDSYSYMFDGGLDETRYAQLIANAEDYHFNKLIIPSGYLWSKINDLASINKCYSEFTHPRQMAHIDNYAAWGDVFYLGHWGDVLFDNMQVDNDMPIDEQVDLIIKKIVKKGGRELSNRLWIAWGLEGKFDDFLYENVKVLLSNINIKNANAQLRAFKSMYWATRWTSVNLSIFQNVKPIEVPYFDNEMCQFVCTVPESILGNRKIQIEYLKKYAPELARIEWQEKRPFNLYNYQKNNPFITLPYRAISKLKRMLQTKKFVQRNWELQFLGEDNAKNLEHYLFHEKSLTEWIPIELIQDFYDKFKNESSINYAHSVSMLLTLSLFSKQSKFN